MENNDEDEAASSAGLNGEVPGPGGGAEQMELDESLTNKGVEICSARGLDSCSTRGPDVSSSSLILLDETASSVIDIQDSTPDVSCEMVSGVAPVTPCTPSAPPRHSDIYITDVYNVSEQAVDPGAKSSGESLSLFGQVRDVVGEFLEPSSLLAARPMSAPLQPLPHVRSSPNDSNETLGSLATSFNVRHSMRVSVAVEYVVSQCGGGDSTLNELMTVRCSGEGRTSDQSSEMWRAPPPPPRQIARLSHASSTSSTSTSSIASSASALARARLHAAGSAPTSPLPPPLSNERISELRDKWINSREVWRLLDYVDRCMSAGTAAAAAAATAAAVHHSQLDQIDEVSGTVTETPPAARRTAKVKFAATEDQQQNVTPRKRPRKDADTADSAAGDTTQPTVTTFNPGDHVFAKWMDRKFYAATLVERRADARWTVGFYDGDLRAVSEENLLRADELAMIGQSVYAAHGDDDFTPGIVTGCEVDAAGLRGLRYSVVRDDRDICVPADHILLTESQARQVRSRAGGTPSQNGHQTPVGGQRQQPSRATRSRTRAALAARDSPVPCGSGTQVKRGGARAAAAAACSSTGGCSDSEDDAASSAAGDEAAVGVVDAVDELPHVAGLEPEAQATYDGCGRLKGKSVAGKMRFGAADADDAALGPLPPTGALPFKGLHVLLSCALSVPVATLPTTDASDVSSTGSSSCENYKFSSAPFVKSRLRLQLEAGGAAVYVRFDDLPAALYKQAYLVTNRPSRTPRYVLCLAAGVRPVCHDWVIRCCAEGRLLPLQDLPSGWSLERERYMCAFERPSLATVKPLRRRLVLVAAGADPAFSRFWTRVCELGEARVRALRADSPAELARSLCVLCECGYRDELTERAMLAGVPLVTTAWLVQTLIHGELRDFDRLRCYRPDHLDSD